MQCILQKDFTPTVEGSWRSCVSHGCRSARSEETEATEGGFDDASQGVASEAGRESRESACGSRLGGDQVWWLARMLAWGGET